MSQKTVQAPTVAGAPGESGHRTEPTLGQLGRLPSRRVEVVTGSPWFCGGG